MKPITKIKDFGAEKLNNLEYTYFATEFAALLVATTAGNLHVEQNLVDTYGSNTNLLKDMTKESRVSDETAKIADIDKQTDDLIINIFEVLRASMKSPIATRRTAATELYNALKPYEGTQSLPQRQEVQAVEGMLVDLEKENLAAHTATLGMNDVVEALNENAAQYRATLEGRSVKQQNSLGSTKEIRKLLDGLYDYITTVAFAYSVVEPTEELNNFIKNTNRLIDDARKAYNLRKGANPDRPLDFPRNKTAVLEGKGLKLVDSPEGKKAQLVLINYVDQRMPHEDSAILVNTDEKIEFTMMYDAAEGQYNFQIETYPNGTEEAVVIKYPETITLI